MKFGVILGLISDKYVKCWAKKNKNGAFGLKFEV